MDNVVHKGHGKMAPKPQPSGPSFINTFASAFKTFASNFTANTNVRGRGQTTRSGRKFWASPR